MRSPEYSKGEVTIYKAKGGPVLDVRLEQETVWLTQKQMSDLFERDVGTVNEHISNVYSEGELNSSSTIRKFRIVQKEGKRLVERPTEFYNLDVVISVGYRFKSLRGTQFRIWATKILKQHLVKGYAVNEKRLIQAQGQFTDLQETIAFLKGKAKHELLTSQGQEILNLLAGYSSTLAVLARCDKEKLAFAGPMRWLNWCRIY